MGKLMMRCTQCGAKNSESHEGDRCRLCGFLLPDFQRRRLTAAGADEGGSFAAAVEEEVGAWKEYGVNGAPKRRHVFDDPDEGNVSPMTIVVALIVAAVIVLGAAKLLIT
jgi:hypothetical protein